jgi:PEP-CTERM motif
MKIPARAFVIMRVSVSLLVLSALLGGVAHADALVGTGSSPFLMGISGLGAPTAITVNWCTFSSAPPPAPPPAPTGCPVGLFDSLGSIFPSNSPQVFEIHPADDADFAAVAASIMSGTNTCEFDASFVPFGGGSEGLGPCAFGPASSVDFLRLTIDPFQVVFDAASGEWLVAGTSGPPAFDGFPFVGATVEAFGTPAVPEPGTLTLALTGLAGMLFRRRRQESLS